jgi:hypothetical protein
VTIDTSEEMKAKLKQLVEVVFAAAVTSEDEDLAKLSKHLNADSDGHTESSKTPQATSTKSAATSPTNTVQSDVDSSAATPHATPRLDYQAVMLAPSGMNVDTTNVKQTFADIAAVAAQKLSNEEKHNAHGSDGPDNDNYDVESQSSEDESSVQDEEASVGDNRDKEVDDKSPLIAPIVRDSEPVSEFGDNDRLYTYAFPNLFLLGRGPPKGSLSKEYLEHLFLRYDRRFNSPTFITTAFNQVNIHIYIYTWNTNTQFAHTHPHTHTYDNHTLFICSIRSLKTNLIRIRS